MILSAVALAALPVAMSGVPSAPQTVTIDAYRAEAAKVAALERELKEVQAEAAKKECGTVQVGVVTPYPKAKKDEILAADLALVTISEELAECASQWETGRVVVQVDIDERGRALWVSSIPSYTRESVDSCIQVVVSSAELVGIKDLQLIYTPSHPTVCTSQ